MAGRQRILCPSHRYGEEEQQWTRLTDEEENTLWCEMQRSGMEVDMRHLHTLLTSSFPEILRHWLVAMIAYALYQRGYRYWFTNQEIKALSRHVNTFEIPKPEYELILTYYRKPVGLEQGTLITCAQILSRFNSTVLHLTMQKIGRAMKELKFEKIRSKNANYWIVVERTVDDVQHHLPGKMGQVDMPF